MYESMREFLNVDTWHTGHPLDMNRFYVALSKIIDNPDFNSEKLRIFMLAEKGLLDETGENSYIEEINRLVSNAQAIHSYKKAVK